MSQLQLSPGSDPLAALRIDRTQRRRSGRGWFGKLFLLILFVALGAGGFYGWTQFGEKLMRVQVRMAKAEVRGADDDDVALKGAIGYLKSEKQAAIGAKVAGRILELKVKEGDYVERGQELAILEHRDLRKTLDAMDASLKAMLASLDVSKAELAEAETALEQDEKDLARNEQLYRKGGLSGADFERAQSKTKGSRSRRDSLIASVRLADARILEAQARKEEMDEQIENMKVRAPFSGTVISKEASEGESIMPGGMGAASGRGSVVTLADLFSLEVETDMKEDNVRKVWPGQEASITVDAVPNRRFKGRVLTIIPMGDRARGTVRVKVRLDKDEVREVNSNLPPRLFPDLTAAVNFLKEGATAQSEETEPKVFAPAAAVKKDDGGSFVWQIVNEKVNRVRVEAGEARDDRIQIERGLKGGEELVLDPSDALSDGLAVRIVP